MRLPFPALLTTTAAASLGLALLAPLTPATGASTSSSSSAVAAEPRAIAYTQWDSGAELRTGARTGTMVLKGRLAVTKAATARRTYAGKSYQVGRWLSPWTTTKFGLTELIASWEATTPGNSWVEIEVRGRTKAGARSSFDVLGRWTSGDSHTKRQTVSGQKDDLASVAVDTWRSNASAGLGSYQLRVSLMRLPGKASPTVDTIGAVASRLPTGEVVESKPGVARGTVLDVPRYSQMVHEGHYPQWGGGGEAWCSPTSTSMVLGYYGALPKPARYSYLPSDHADPWVDHAARMTYDTAYDGTGNWPFNTAYAAAQTGSAFVTRLRSMREAERFIAAGIPLVISVAFASGELTGAPISATDGHLLVVVGFTQSGDVVVNDPASPTRAGVRRTYDRGELENAWLPTTGGTAYVITDPTHPVPATAHSNW
ncbi:peptidase C39 family protein [Nocardioides sp. cx-173]|uniref:peptidase C39 family protein n=1 Tax=Nocardioides sp. cx-173 TaxID=2898796 RepID=UPI001E2E38C7|nr:peptidase C39 family protein [Nocardioides sp. cx-173]MCD4526502.1 peptidase C39 family protein [Nocardioides sp. cx-173]UGB41189.1 peptidase C39 family protein [Nocardioides sp. cx-173]